MQVVSTVKDWQDWQNRQNQQNQLTRNRKPVTGHRQQATSNKQQTLIIVVFFLRSSVFLQGAWGKGQGVNETSALICGF